MSLPPGLKIAPILGTYRLVKYPYELLEDGYRRFGDIFTLPTVRLGPIISSVRIVPGLQVAPVSPKDEAELAHWD